LCYVDKELQGLEHVSLAHHLDNAAESPSQRQLDVSTYPVIGYT